MPSETDEHANSLRKESQKERITGGRRGLHKGFAYSLQSLSQGTFQRTLVLRHQAANLFDFRDLSSAFYKGTAPRPQSLPQETFQRTCELNYHVTSLLQATFARAFELSDQAAKFKRFALDHGACQWTHELHRALCLRGARLPRWHHRTSPLKCLDKGKAQQLDGVVQCVLAPECGQTQDRHLCASPTDSLSVAESTHPAWARVATGQSIPSSIASSFFTIFTNSLLGLLIIFKMCVIAPAHFVFAGCTSPHPPWAASPPKTSSVRAQREDSKQPPPKDTRRPSTEYTWALEALSFDYEF